MVTSAYAINAYRKSRAEVTTNPLELVIMLYEGAIESLGKAVMAIDIQNIQMKLKQMDKALAIIEELSNALNFEVGGEIALNLSDLYYYMMRELLLANIHNDKEKIEQVISLLKGLREAWVEIKKDKVPTSQPQ
ncbi:MAG: flagellar export chaperone FliS [Candidatus Tectomicrobia bacterium]|uniref:Flagellar secretion chaperone FliS n=1 Tax=Tectimicrobiota bacterium TaxID=2528274 RepID=A0A932G1B7_UNCTE|nr:flagellar export chaperone FliS [Candidatus Tectomicrobia bacterium]